MGVQNAWRFCSKCNAMFFDGFESKGVCPQGGGHGAQGFDFNLPFDGAETPNIQRAWRFCGKCNVMFFDGFPEKGNCATGGGHSAAGFMFSLPHDIPASASAQDAWRFCHKCNSMFFDGFPTKGTCPSGGGHEAAGFMFVLPHGGVPAPIPAPPPPPPPAPVENANNQSDWRFCRKCMGMFWDREPDKGQCATGGGHDAAGFMFVLPHDIGADEHRQNNWRFCGKCKSMFFDGFPEKGSCPAGAGHAAIGFGFVLPHDIPGHARAQNQWRFCTKCAMLHFDGFVDKGPCAAGGTHSPAGFEFVLPHGDVPPPPPPVFENANNQAHWRFCTKCAALHFDGFAEKGTCAGGGEHTPAGFEFVLPHDVPETPLTQSFWRFCTKCQSMFFDGRPEQGICPGGGAHIPAGFIFTLPHDVPHTTFAQSDWRFCHKCNVMFFDGRPEKGSCPGGGGHEAAGFTFVLPHDLRTPFHFGAQIVTGGLAALGGNMSVTVNLDGTMRWRGHAHNSGLDGNSFAVSAVIRTPSGRNIALAHQGHVGGTLTAGSRDHDWDDVVPTPPVANARLSELTLATFETHLEFESDIGSVFETLVSWIVKFGVGSALGPVGAVVFVGLPVASLITEGSLAPGARLAGGILWMAGPANTLFAIAAEGIAQIGTRSRDLTEEEYNWANDMVFAGSLPPRDRLLLTDIIGGGDRAFVFPRFDGKITLNMGASAFDDPRKYRGQSGNNLGRTFIHELVHTCQIHHEPFDLSLLTDALGSKICEIDGDPYAYGMPGPDYRSFNLEQQAQIVSDWYAGNSSRANTAHTGVPRDPNSPYFRYITDNLRVSLF